MKKVFLVLSLYTVTVFADNNNELTVEVSAQNNAKMKVLIGVVGDAQELQRVAACIKKDLEFSGQCAVTIQKFAQLNGKCAIKKLSKKGMSLAVFLSDAQCGAAIEWRMYDTLSCSMLSGKKYTKQGTEPRGWGHNIADSLWPALTGQPGFFSSKIAYCKDIHKPGARKIKHIYVADYDGSNEQPLVATPTVNVAPRWNMDKNNPLLFYSECTQSNMRLVWVAMNKSRRVASNFDGLNMLPAFSGDGKKVVYCASHGDGNCQLYHYHKGKLKQLTNNNGNNVSPCFSADGNKLFFCSDFQTKLPQVYCLDMKRKKLERISQSGYCATPSYSDQSGNVAYTKMISGVMQLFLYNPKTKQHTQLTKNSGNKEECSWSPCGNYLLFSVAHGANSRLACLNTLTNTQRYLGKKGASCTYPSWSPLYNKFPTVG